MDMAVVSVILLSELQPFLWSIYAESLTCKGKRDIQDIAD